MKFNLLEAFNMLQFQIYDSISGQGKTHARQGSTHNSILVSEDTLAIGTHGPLHTDGILPGRHAINNDANDKGDKH